MTPSELWLRLTYPLRRRRLEADLRDEMALHVDLRAAELQRSGLTSADAALAARRRFGNRSRIADASREAWGWHWLEGTLQDLRYVARQLRHTPGFALVACLTIALGVAINATAFIFYDAIVLKPLPVRDAARVIRVTQDRRAFAAELLPFAAYDILRREAHTVQSLVTTTQPQSLGAVLPGRANDDIRFVNARFVSADFSVALGVQAAYGRWFDATDDRAVVLDHGFWTRALGADPTVIGRRIRIGDAELTIVGIAPARFAGTGLPAVAPDLWLPLATLGAIMPNAHWRDDGRPHWELVGRIAPSASLAQVAFELATLSAAVPDSAGKPIPLAAKHATFFQTDSGEFEVLQQVSVAFMVALALILAIAAVNLANLFAARNAAREREVTVRLALGARRSRIARQLASESVLLAVVGGSLGLIVSHSLALWLRDWLTTTVTSVTGGLAGIFLDVDADWRVGVYAALLSLGIGLGVGLWPALRAARGDVNSVLRQGSTSTGGVGLWGKRNLLLGVQVASSLLLLTAAGMLLGGLRLANEIQPGFDADHLLVVAVDDDAVGTARIVRREAISRRLAELPEVRSVAWSSRVPFAGTHLRHANTASGQLTISIDEGSAGYFETMGMPILRGRGFTSQEVETNAPVMLVSESLARRRWPNGDAVGRSLPVNDILSGSDTTKSYSIIGVVRDIRSNFLSRVNGASAYYPHGFDGSFGAFLVRTHGTPAAATNAVRVAIAGVSPLLGGRTHIVTLQGGPMAVQRLMAEAPAALALVLAVAGLVLASVGVYGLISQIVTRRTREIGVHMAIGARPMQVVALIARKTLRPVAWGAAAGAVGALALCFFLRALISVPDVPDLTFGAGAFNPLVLAGVLASLLIAVLAACIVPAHRAAHVDPTVALRSE